MSSTQDLDQNKIVELLGKLSDNLAQKNCHGELCLVGGAVMVLAFNARKSTHDIDGVFVPISEVRVSVQQVAENEGLEISWLNDAVKGFLNENIEKTTDMMPQFSNLKVFRASDEYLLAMKVKSARLSVVCGEKSNDLIDLEFLVKRLNVRDVDSGLKIVERYFPTGGMAPNMQYFLAEAIENVFGGGV